MKKISFAVLSASAIFMASCSSDDLQFSQGDGYRDGMVNFTVEMPAGFATRAVNDGLSATQLDYAVFDENGKFLFDQSAAAVISNKTTNVQVPLVNGKTYNVAFFAKHPEAPYSIENGQLKVNYPATNPANDDRYDAFYNAVEVSVSPSMTVSQVTLKRPFAQVNFAANDWDAAKTAGLTVRQSGVAFSAEVYNTMNLADGTLEGNPESVIFTVNTLPDYDANGAANITVANNDYKHVGMAYVLAPASSEALLINTVTYNYIGAADATFSHDITSVPVKRNHRTNIVGSFFTVQAPFTIIVDQAFDEPDLEPAMFVEANELKAAIENASSGAIIAVKAGEITSQLIGLDTSKVNGKDITIIGAPEYGTYVDFANVSKGGEGTLIYLNGLGDIVFKDIKFNTPNTIVTYVGLCRAESVVYDNCLFEGVTFGYIAKENFIGCTFNLDVNAYPFWTYGAKDITMESCVFNNSAKGKNILVYGDSGDLTVKLTLNNCTFNTEAPRGDKCAVEIHTELGSNGTLVINNCTVNGNGWLNENDGLWREVDNYKGTNGEPTFNFDVFVDGVHVQTPIVKGANGEYLIDNPQIFKHVLTNIVNSASEPVVIDIQSDIDMSGVEYKHSDLGYSGPHPTQHITINGNGHTISNLEVNGLQATLIPWTSQGFTINNLNIKDSSFLGNNKDNDYGCAAAFGAFCDNTSVKVSNCTLDGVKIGNAKYIGGFVAYCSGKESAFENCEVKNCTIINDFYADSKYKGHCGGIIGASYGAVMTGCSVKDNTFTVNGDRNGIFAGSLWTKGMSGTASASGNTGLSSYVGSVGTTLFTATVN